MEAASDVVPYRGHNDKESSLWIQRRRILWMIHAVLVTTVCFLLQQQVSLPLSQKEQYTNANTASRAAAWFLLYNPPPYSYVLLIPIKYSLTTYLLRRAQQDEFPLLSPCSKWTLHVLPELWLGIATLALVVADHSPTTLLHYGVAVALFMLVLGILGIHTYIWCQVLWRYRPHDELEMDVEEDGGWFLMGL